LGQKCIQRDIHSARETLAILLQVLRRNCFQAALYVRERIHHAMEIFGADADDLDVIERRTGCSAATS
jgi:hypothetical protein